VPTTAENEFTVSYVPVIRRMPKRSLAEATKVSTGPKPWEERWASAISDTDLRWLSEVASTWLSRNARGRWRQALARWLYHPGEKIASPRKYVV
jgi:hypothetical protein